MAWGGSQDAEVDVVYEPLPEMDGDELRRLRETIGLADDSSERIRPRASVESVDSVDAVDDDDVRDDRVPLPRSAPLFELRDSDPPDSNMRELLEEVDRKLEKLIEMGPLPVFNTFFGEALVSLHADLADVQRQLAELHASVEALTHALLGA
ncbi:MAG: hypothetical protein QOI95_334 [Acidimicrobiaceae bacterium]|jgi:hypothetical protein